ncbi:MAG TPA: PKD domain-containing protein [Verrucomicrobiae bacterium]|nr:PKD domain-containing protein [Verrucomicrobiae bacterium]
MLRLIMRGTGLLLLLFLLVPAGFSKNPAKKAKRELKKTADTTAATSSDTTASSEPAKAEITGAAESSPPAVPSLPAKNGPDDDYKPAPKFTPMLATTGTIGLFTLETADTLPKHGFAFSAFGNKFGRMPGSVTILKFGADLSYGITDTLNIYAAFDPYGHVHVGCPGQLTLRSIPLNTCAPLALGIPAPTSFFPTALGSAPGYVEDYPFASNNNGGIGNITLGLKYAFLSERQGAPISFSVRNDLIISTKTDLNKLLANGTQASPLSDMVSLALSKQWSNSMTATFNFGYMFVRAPRDNQAQPLFDMPDQVRMGVGFLMFPESRFQPMAEYSGVVFVTAPNTPPDTSFGARDPIDGVWGLRMYPWKNIGIDVGYRRMLNLRDLNDRSGFVVKIGTAYWPEKAPPVNHPPTVSCTADKSMVYLDSGDAVAIRCTGSDPDNDPLTYTWTSTGGKVDGTGSQVRWLSAGTPLGSDTITAKVDDGRGGSASSSVAISVEPKPNHPPTITCSADRSSVFAGEKVHITTNANDPDGDKLAYTWRANAGQIVGSGATADFDTSGLAPGNYSVTVRVDDGRGGAADCSSTVEVKTVPPPPLASKISDCAFGKPLSTRIDNVCKRILDDVALRLQNEPRGSAVIIGYSDPKEAKPEKIAGDRATNGVKYLGEKGIDASRITTRTGAGQAGATDNRRIDVIWVPEGATY